MKTREIIRGEIANRVYRTLGTVYASVRYDMVRVKVEKCPRPDGAYPFNDNRLKVTVQIVLPERPSWQGHFYVVPADNERYEWPIAKFLVDMLDQLAEYQPECR